MGQPLFYIQSCGKNLGRNSSDEEFGLHEIRATMSVEFWAISAHPCGVSKVANGPYEGMRLDQLIRHQELFGNRKDFFPLLTKDFDANDWLSVQVHPDDTYAMEHEGELGKLRLVRDCG